ncbi:MAG: NapC/NirT family cytochrome c, partial [Candidatus Sedimenticola sp. (ex Thyasira tokunagai)]
SKRLELAEKVWRSMRESDSRECRNRHAYEYMDFHKQRRRSAEKMQEAVEKRSKESCIDCHKGIAHKIPKNDDEDDHL